MPPSTISSLTTTIQTTLTRPLKLLNLLNRHMVSTRSSSTMSKLFKVAKLSDLKDGQMKEVDIPGTEGKVLLSRVKGEYYATGAKCTRTFYPPFPSRFENVGN